MSKQSSKISPSVSIPPKIKMADEAVETVEEEEEEEEEVEGEDEDVKGPVEEGEAVGMSDEVPLARGRGRGGGKGGVFPEFSNCKTSLISPPSAATS